MNTHKRKTVDQADSNPRTLLKSRFLVRNVYLLGFPEAEAQSLKANAVAGLTFANTLSSQITHIVLNPASTSLPQPREKFYFAALSGAEIVRPSWLTDPEGKKDHLWDTCQMEVQYAPKTSGLLNLIKLWKRFKQTRHRPFSSPAFSKTVILFSGGENDEAITDFRSCFEVGGGELVASTVIDEIVIRPKSIRSRVSLAVFFPGYSPDSLTELLLTAGVPVIPHTALYDIIETEDLKKSLEDVCTAYWANTSLSNAEKTTMEKARDSGVGRLAMEKTGSAHSATPFQSLGTVRLGTLLPEVPSPTYVQWMDFFPLLEQRLKSMEATSELKLHQNIHSHTDFMDNVSEMKKNEKHKEVHDIICLAATSLIRNSECPQFLPSHDVLSILFHEIALKGAAIDLGIPNAIFRLMGHVLQKFPPYDKDSREYWLQVLTPPQGKTRGSRSYNFVSDALAAFRTLLNKILSSSVVDLNLLHFVVQLLETDLFMLQKGNPGLVKGPQRLVKESTTRRFVDDVDSLPFAYLLMHDDPHDVKKLGIDEKATKFMDNLGQQLAIHELTGLTGRLFSRLEMVCLEGIRWTVAQRDPTLQQFENDARRIVRHLLAKEFSPERLNQLLPLKWIIEATQNASA